MNKKLTGSRILPFQRSTILSHRHYKRVCLLSMLVYLVLHMLLGMNHWYSSSPICELSRTRATWTRDFNIGTAGAFIIAICFQLNRIFLSTFREENDIGTLSSYYASLCVNTIAAISHCSVLLYDWGGTCVDAFGVEFPAAIWPEWIISVPLLAFITLSVDDKPYLSKEDVAYIISIFLSLLLGFFTQTSKDPFTEIVLMFFSSIFITPCVLIAFRANHELQLLLSKSQANESKKGLYQRKILLASRKATLAYCIGFLLPVFPMVYLCSILGFLDRDGTFLAFMFMSAFTKLLFASLCMDAHLEVSHPAIALIDAENFSHTSRRAFLRYVFHEVRVPLNSIALGIQVLSSEENLTPSEVETLTMIREAASFMGETLNDVMALQTVEEGSMELIFKPFVMLDLFHNIQNSFTDAANEGNIQFVISVDENVPNMVIGDKFRIRHIIANLVSNAIKYSKKGGGKIELIASADEIEVDENFPRYDEGKFVAMKISVVDEGIGISEEDQEEDIFQPYRQLKQGDLHKGRGRGLGLAICKEIVHMHGGQISYSSKVGQGSTFTVLIPLEISNAPLPPSWTTSYRKFGERSFSESHLNVLVNNSYSYDFDEDGNVVTPKRFSMTSDENQDLISSTLARSTSAPLLNPLEVLSTGHEHEVFDEIEKEMKEEGGAVTAVTTSHIDPITTTTISLATMSKDPSRTTQRRSIRSTTSSSFTTTRMNSKTITQSTQISSAVVKTGSSSMSIHPSNQSSITAAMAAAVDAVEGNGCDRMKSTSPDHFIQRIDSSRSSSSPVSSQRHIPTVGAGLTKITTTITTTTNVGNAAGSSTTTTTKNSPDHKRMEESPNNRSFSMGRVDTSTPRVTRSMNMSDGQSAQLIFPPINNSTTSMSAQNESSTTSNHNNNQTVESKKSTSSSSSSATSATTSTTSTSTSGLSTNSSSSTTTTSTSSATSSSSGSSIQRVQDIQVLIVDDVLSNRKLLALLLNKKGISKVQFAEDGQIAIDIVNKRGIAFDMVFMDNTMPNMTGIEATRVLRRTGFGKLIIGVTGNSMLDELEEFTDSGADLVITKPMKPNILDYLLEFAQCSQCNSNADRQISVDKEGHLVWTTRKKSVF